MKKILTLTLAITLASFSSLALADDATIVIKKASDTTATVGAFPDAKTSSVVPITFDSGASWDNVKDSYTVSSDVAAALANKKIAISIGSDGTASFHKK